MLAALCQALGSASDEVAASAVRGIDRLMGAADQADLVQRLLYSSVVPQVGADRLARRVM